MLLFNEQTQTVVFTNHKKNVLSWNRALAIAMYIALQCENSFFSLKQYANSFRQGPCLGNI